MPTFSGLPILRGDPNSSINLKGWPADKIRLALHGARKQNPLHSGWNYLAWFSLPPGTATGRKPLYTTSGRGSPNERIPIARYKRERAI